MVVVVVVMVMEVVMVVLVMAVVVACADPFKDIRDFWYQVSNVQH